MYRPNGSLRETATNRAKPSGIRALRGVVFNRCDLWDNLNDNAIDRMGNAETNLAFRITKAIPS